MKLYLDIHSGLLLRGPNMNSPLPQLEARRGAGEYIALQLLNEGEPWQAPGGTEFMFVVKKPGDFGGTALALADTFIWNASTELYEAAINYETEALDALLLIESTAENSSIKLDAQVAIQQPSLGNWRHSQIVEFVLYNQLWREGDAAALPSASLLRPSVISITSDVVNDNASANTLADVTGLQFPVTAGKRYGFKFMIPYTAASTTTGCRWTITGPSSPTMLAYSSEYPLTATNETTNHASAYGVPSASNATSLTAGNLAIIEGVIEPSVDGNVKAQFASEVSGSAITAKAGACVMFWEMP